MKTKKIIAAAIAAALFVCMLALPAFAAETGTTSTSGTTIPESTEITAEEEPHGEASWVVGSEKKYGNFDEAVKALSDTGGTITLLSDAHLTGTAVITGNISVNGDYMLYIEADAYIFEGASVVLNCNVNLTSGNKVENSGTLYVKCVANKICDGTYSGNEIQKLHHWNSGSVDVEPTYEKEGSIKYVCFDCLGTKSESLPKLIKRNTSDIITLVFILAIAGLAVICIAGMTATGIYNKKHATGVSSESQGEQ